MIRCRPWGADRIANAVAGYELYGGNGACITVDFGTATTFGVISEDGVFLGGSIAPGIRSASEALTSRAAQLRRFNFAKPDHVLATNTIEAMQAGVMYGFAGLADNILAKLKMEVGPAFVVATGGLSDVIAGDTHHINTVDKLLTLKGFTNYIQQESLREVLTTMKHKIALLGLGTVGLGTYQLIEKNAEIIRENTGQR